MNKQEKQFAESIQNKIQEYKIPTTLKEVLQYYSDTFIETEYSDGTTELVDMGIEYRLCQLSAFYFIKRYAYIEIPGIGTLPFSLYYFQEETLKLLPTLKKTVFNKTRQAGISTLTSIYCFWLGNFHDSESIDVVSTKQSKAQAYVSKMDATYKNMPLFLRTPVKNKNMHGVKWENNSQIISETASETAGRGDSLSLLVLDEAAHYQSDRLTRGIIGAAMPTLSRTGGGLVVISCLTKDTYIYTDKGIQQIEDYIPNNCQLGFNKIDDFKIDGIKLHQDCNTFYDSGITPTITLNTKFGFRLTGSPIHPVLTLREGKIDWVQLKDLRLKDKILSSLKEKKLGSLEYVNFEHIPTRKTETYLKIDKLTEDISYLIGVYIAEGYLDKSKYKITISATEKQIIDRVCKVVGDLGFSYGVYNKKVDIYGKGLVKFFEFLGFKRGEKSYDKIIPKKVLMFKKDLLKNILIGMYDGDGCNNHTNRCIDYCSYSSELLYQVKIILLAFGIHSSIQKSSKCVRIYSHRQKFLEKIGFHLTRKQEQSLNSKITKNYILEGFEEEEYFYDEIVDIYEDEKKHTYDFTVPETSSFYANGIITHNTPNGTHGSGAYYYEQVNALQIKGNSGIERLIEIDWWEIPDIKNIKPYRGYNDKLNEFIKKDYFNNPMVKEAAKRYFRPIEEKWRENDFLNKQYEDLGNILFKQEIFHNFIVAEDQVFSEDVIEEIRTKIRNFTPLYEDSLKGNTLKGLVIWNLPAPKKRYILSADVASGTGKDYSAIEIMDIENYEQVAEYKGKLATKNFSKVIKTLARYYNQAFVIIESNSIGEAVFNEVYYHDSDPYDNVYKQKKSKNGITRFTGWETNVKSRQLMTNDLIDWINVEDLRNRLIIKSPRLLNEMITWVWKSGNKAEHQDNSNDDLLISFALCIHLRNKATEYGESFFIGDDGTLFQFTEEDKSRDVSDGFGFETTENIRQDAEDIIQDEYGIGLDEYKWLIG